MELEWKHSHYTNVSIPIGLNSVENQFPSTTTAIITLSLVLLLLMLLAQFEPQRASHLTATAPC